MGTLLFSECGFLRSSAEALSIHITFFGIGHKMGHLYGD